MFLGLAVPTTSTLLYEGADRFWRLGAESIWVQNPPKLHSISLISLRFEMLAGAKGLEPRGLLCDRAEVCRRFHLAVKRFRGQVIFAN